MALYLLCVGKEEIHKFPNMMSLGLSMGIFIPNKKFLCDDDDDARRIKHDCIRLFG